MGDSGFCDKSAIVRQFASFTRYYRAARKRPNIFRCQNNVAGLSVYRINSATSAASTGRALEIVKLKVYILCGVASAACDYNIRFASSIINTGSHRPPSSGRTILAGCAVKSPRICLVFDLPCFCKRGVSNSQYLLTDTRRFDNKRNTARNSAFFNVEFNDISRDSSF